MSAKIAVVEDNPDNRLLVSAILDDLYEISEYETGAEAIDGLPQDPPASTTTSRSPSSTRTFSSRPSSVV